MHLCPRKFYKNISRPIRYRIEKFSTGPNGSGGRFPIPKSMI